MRICSVEKCENKSYGSSEYCSRHYQQLRHCGEIKKRTNKDPNEFIIDGNICWVILYNRKCIEIARAKFYTIYYEIIKNYKWHLDVYGYAETNWVDGCQKMSLHVAIMHLRNIIIPEDHQIDHKDGDTLNCLDENLRVCTYSQNQHNAKIRKDNKSGAKGVSWHKQCKKWQTSIVVNGTQIHRGLFNTIEEAAREYNKAAKEFFGEFAVLNNTQGEYIND